MYEGYHQGYHKGATMGERVLGSWAQGPRVPGVEEVGSSGTTSKVVNLEMPMPMQPMFTLTPGATGDVGRHPSGSSQLHVLLVLMM